MIKKAFEQGQHAAMAEVDPHTAGIHLGTVMGRKSLHDELVQMPEQDWKAFLNQLDTHRKVHQSKQTLEHYKPMLGEKLVDGLVNTL